MGKYIIDIVDTTDRLICVGVEDGSTYTYTALVEGLMPYTAPDLEQVRKEAYEQGLNDAREGKATCQYCEYQYLDDTEEPCKKCCNAYMNKYKPKAKEEQIQVGDEVNAPFGKAIVVNIDSNAEKIWFLYADGHSGFDFFKNTPTKTGRRFPEIAEALRKMRE